MLLLHDKDRQ